MPPRTRLVSRPSRAIPAAVVGLVLLALGAAGTWIIGTLLVNGEWPAAAASAVSAIGSTALNDRPAIVLAAALCLSGLVCVLCALLPGHPGRRTIMSDDVPGVTAVPDRDVLRRIDARVEQVDGVQRARSTLRGTRLTMIVRTPIEDTDAVSSRSRTVMDEALAELRTDRTLRPRVRTIRTI